MFGNIGTSEFILIAVVALILFGPAKLPEIGRTVGNMIREFKQGARELLNDLPTDTGRRDVTPPPAPAQTVETAAPAQQSSAAVSPQEASAGDDRSLSPDSGDGQASVTAGQTNTSVGAAASASPAPDPVGRLAPIQDPPQTHEGGETGKESRSNPRRLPD
ncbi:twin-arginine translocase TatA/TatE family subunit [Paenibacillus filicis]|uniref:Sec-independent protein translocase protein TatA n=1 Tax=Paenibacillus filicis TaxID=669464 RepID=A0ABU9DQD8_9BACL